LPRAPGEKNRRELDLKNHGLVGYWTMSCRPPTVLSRRRAVAGLLGITAAYALLDTLVRADALATTDGVDVRRLWKEIHVASRSSGPPDIWQRRVESLLTSVPLTDLCQAIRFDRLRGRANLRAREKSVQLLTGGQLPVRDGLAYRVKLYALRRGRAIVPHGHNGRLSAFLVLAGSLRGRHYDRVRDLPDAIEIRPSIDRIFRPGSCSSISDTHDNIHWFTGESDEAYLFNVSLNAATKLSRGRPGRVYLDPAGEPLADGLVRAPRATLGTLRARYDG